MIGKGIDSAPFRGFVGARRFIDLGRAEIFSLLPLEPKAIVSPI
ncbi:MAG TPA: hypothetical protein VGH90_04765 [Chthoniobacteraceae bacterium]|jgi:hypothetical protein